MFDRYVPMAYILYDVRVNVDPNPYPGTTLASMQLQEVKNR